MCLTNHCTLTSGIIIVYKRHSGFLFCWEKTYPDLGDKSPSNQRSSSVIIFTFLLKGVFWIKFFVLFSVQGNMLNIFCCCSHTHWTLLRLKMASVFLACKWDKMEKKVPSLRFQAKNQVFLTVSWFLINQSFLTPSTSMSVDIGCDSLQEGHHCAFLPHLPDLQRVKPNHDATQETKEQWGSLYKHICMPINWFTCAACIHTVRSINKYKGVAFSLSGLLYDYNNNRVGWDCYMYC